MAATGTAGLCEILRLASDAAQPGFVEATRTIAERTEALDLDFFRLLLDLVGSDCSDTRVVFVALAVAQNYYRTQGNRHVIPYEFCELVFNVCWSRFSSENAEVRRQAAALLGMMSEQYVSCLGDLGIVPRLVAVLEAGMSAGIGVLEAAMDLLHQILSAFSMNDIEEKAFFLAVKLMWETTETNIVKGCLLLLVDTKIGFRGILDKEDECTMFLERVFVLYQVDILKIPVIEFFDAMCTEYGDRIFPVVCNKWLAVTLEHCQTFDKVMKEKLPCPDNMDLMGNVAKELLFFWENRARYSNEQVCVELARHLMEICLSMMQNVTSAEIPDVTEWEPYTAAESLVRRFAEEVPGCVQQVVQQFITANVCCPDSGARQAALKCYTIYLYLLRTEGDEFPASLVQLVKQLGEDEDPRIRFLAISCLEPIYGIFGVEAVTDRIEYLLSRVTDVEQIAKLAFKLLSKISKDQRLPNPKLFYERLVACLEVASPTSPIAPEILECLSFAIVHRDLIPQCLSFMVEILSHVATKCQYPGELTELLLRAYNIMSVYYSCNPELYKDVPVVSRLWEVTYTLHSRAKVGADVLLMSMIAMNSPELTHDANTLITVIQTDIQELHESRKALRSLVCALLLIGEKASDSDVFNRVMAIISAVAKVTKELSVVTDCLVSFDMLLRTKPKELRNYFANYVAMTKLCIAGVNQTLDEFSEKESIEAAESLLKPIQTFVQIASKQPPGSQGRNELFEIIRWFFATVSDRDVLLQRVREIKPCFEFAVANMKEEFMPVLADQGNCYSVLFQRILSLP